MPQLTRHCWLFGATLALLTAAQNDSALAQPPTGYGQFYQQQSSYAGRAGLGSPERYLYDKYFLHSPGVSPYMNVFRPDPVGTTSYHAYVQPEIRRRTAAAGARSIGPPAPGAYSTGRQAPRAAAPSAYYNHWYGGWNNR